MADNTPNLHMAEQWDTHRLLQEGKQGKLFISLFLGSYSDIRDFVALERYVGITASLQAKTGLIMEVKTHQNAIWVQLRIGG